MRIINETPFGNQGPLCSTISKVIITFGKLDLNLLEDLRIDH